MSEVVFTNYVFWRDELVFTSTEMSKEVIRFLFQVERYEEKADHANFYCPYYPR
ncbi:hypothetical protein [Paenibacillus sp. FSL P4-0288]|uniref:hypothetical protein n=1 Tax=Paenibacillus sp. FSL P4-0288 TaxID=2921633 RepID=UPI0030F6B97D